MSDTPRLTSTESIESLFRGRTIKEVKAAVNCLLLTFTDGGIINLEVEAFHPTLGLYGIAVREEREAGDFDPAITFSAML